VEQLEIYKKTGFRNLFPHRPLIINDSRGILFYSTEGLQPIEQFNLPAGTYSIVSGNIKELPNPIPVKLASMPMIERIMQKADNFKIIFDVNPNKCTIDWENETITFDDSFMSKTLPEIFFVLYHEMGHVFYVTERYADLFAANLMRKKGYNDSQIGCAQITALSEIQFPRKNFLINKILS
jgi:hypothetical protein